MRTHLSSTTVVFMTRHLPLLVAAVITGFAVAEFDVLLVKAVAQDSTVGVDLHYYLGYTNQWLAGDGFYAARQLDGPYGLQPGDSLYPPFAILLFLPFEVLPEFLWWALPLCVLAYVVWRLHPAPWTLPVFALIALWPRTLELLVYGNPTMWVAAFAAAGIVWAWPSPLVWIKPTLAPFALIGIGRRRWWVATALVAVAAVPFGSLWLDYVHAIGDVQDTGGALYSAKELPFMAVSIVAWLGSRDRVEYAVASLSAGRWRRLERFVNVARNPQR